MVPNAKRLGGDTTAEARRVQHELYRKMSPGKKLELVFASRRLGKELALAGIRLQNPHADDEELWHLWARRQLGAEAYDLAYGAMSCE
ncbi:MAG: hypothetical protein JW993_13760 [Sedimentisphaerales bacterium]|nr:hypothetical protein [Sedimentisphaerales bacterium]